MAKTYSGPNRWKATPIALALLSGVWGADSAFAAPDALGTDLGIAVNFTLTVNPPGAQTNPAGGGPFVLALASALPPSPLPPGLAIPSSVLAWCIETTQFISVGVANTAELYSQTPSKLGGFVLEGLQWLNITAGVIQFTTKGDAYFSTYKLLGWTADEVAAAIQQKIWEYQLPTGAPGKTLPSTIGNQDSIQTTNLLNDLDAYASSHNAAYYRLNWSGQDQVFGVPGPIAGAGLPGLLLACGALLAFARRRRQSA